jgi:DNA polymerase-3 subunit chi
MSLIPILWAHLHLSPINKDFMTSIDFYILGQTQHLDRFRFVCNLVSKVYGEGRNIYIHTQNEDDAKQLDILLWEYKD